jgi:uncharacterized delta-60 repeat protein
MNDFKIAFFKTEITLSLLMIFSLFFTAACNNKEPLITWEKTYGGGSRDRAYSIHQAADKGYFVAAQTSSFSAGGYDYYILKLDERGNKSWEKTFGGENAEIPRCIRRTTDGGCIVAGRTSSFSPGYCDFYIIKLDQNGNKNWEKVYGGDSWDDPWSIQQTADGGYVVAGFTESTGAGGNDVYIMKLDTAGDRVWEKTFGGALNDAANSIQQTADGGYAVAGFTESIGAGGLDVYIMKLDTAGELVWEKTFGGTLNDAANSVQQTADGGYVVAGFTESNGAGGSDVYILKIDVNGERVWEKTFGGTRDDEALSIHQNKDKSYIVAGYIGSADATDMYLARLNEDGSIRWERTFGETGEDKAYEVQQTLDEGFVVAGYVHPDDAVAEYDDNIYVLKLNKTGELN